jgi:intracellular sulfur oxidation DsrE/DsrF family protein
VVAAYQRAKRIIKDMMHNPIQVVGEGPATPDWQCVHGVAVSRQNQSRKGEIMFSKLRVLFASLGIMVITCLSSACGVLAAETPATPTYHVVFAVTVDDQHVWNEVFGNFRNIQRDMGPANVEIEVVVYGDGIAMLRDDSLVYNKVEQAIEEGVKIVACENTMKAQNISRDHMLPNISYVTAGIVELIKLQAAGWAYVRP